MPKDPDAKLKALIESGDKDELARGLVKPVLGVLLRRNADEDAASAALGPAVKALLSSRRRFKSDMSVRAWILSVVTAKVPSEKPVAPLIEHLPAFQTAAEFAASEDIVDDAEALLSALGGEEREALELLAVEGLSPAEAGAILKTPSAIVEHRAEAALAKLSDIVAPLSK